jgi:EmrB/QacA subfamily drug resistance transporter
MHPTKPRTRWTLAIVSLALFMVVLDNLIVTVALPSIQKDLGATLQQLEWTVNAYTLAFAVTLIPGAAIGDRFGRKRTFLAGLALFTASSAAAALAPGAAELVAARAAQGIGGAIVAPLTLTLLAEAFPPERRGAALGIWSGISGMGIALGPLVGGAVVDGLSWQWIFWINVPLGIALLPLAAGFLNESRGTATRLDLPGVALVTSGLFGLVYGLVRGQGEGWGSPVIVTSLVAGALLLAAFVAHERRTPEPMLPLDLFRKRAFAVTNGISFFMYFGTFGSIFLITQFVQQVMGYAPFDAGVRMLVWTGATAITSPIAGVLAERRGPRALMAAGLALQAGALAWLAMAAGVDSTNSELAPAFAIAGIGMGLVFAPSASALLSVVAPQRAGQASGTNNAVREVGGVFGVAVMSTIFAHAGSFASPQAFVDGFTPALWVGAAVVGAGALVALFLPARRAVEQHAAEAVEAPAAVAAAQPAAA